MNVTLGSFVIANGFDRTLQVPTDERISLSQQTQVATPLRASWPVAFPDRAVRTIPLSFTVVFPPCDSLSQALMQAHTILAQCPTGGVLVVSMDGDTTTYAAAWLTASRCDRIGVTNRFSFDLDATNPTAVSLLADELGDVLQDESGTDISN
jgi:hypothetical protein